MPEGVYRRIPGFSPASSQNDILWCRAEKSISSFCGSATLTHEEIATSVLRCSLYLDQGISERVPLEKSSTRTDTGSLGQQRVPILGLSSSLCRSPGPGWGYLGTTASIPLLTAAIQLLPLEDGGRHLGAWPLVSVKL